MDHRSVETFRLDIGGWKGWDWFDSIYNKCKNIEQKSRVVVAVAAAADVPSGEVGDKILKRLGGSRGAVFFDSGGDSFESGMKPG